MKPEAILLRVRAAKMALGLIPARESRECPFCRPAVEALIELNALERELTGELATGASK